MYFSHLSKEKINSGQMMALNNYNVEGLVSNCGDHLEENLTFTNDALTIIIHYFGLCICEIRNYCSKRLLHLLLQTTL